MSGLIVICTLEASGSTWLNRLLCAHPSIRGGGETRLFEYMQPLMKRLTTGMPSWGVSSRQYQTCLADLARDLLCIGDVATVEKTPGHWRFLPQINKLFPGTRFIWLKRATRDHWTRSMMSKPHEKREEQELWAEYHEFCTRMGKWLDAGKYDIVTVEYESLWQDPERQLTRLLRQLDEDSSQPIVKAMLMAHPAHSAGARKVHEQRKLERFAK